MRHEIEAYFIRHYRLFVLKPEIRDAVIARGLEAAVKRAHASYLRVVANVDLRLQLFLARHTELLDAGKATAIRSLKLDWDAQAFKAPRYALEDQALRALYRGAQVVGVSALIAHTVGPAIEARIAALFAAVAGRVMTALAPEITATLSGTALGGPFTGWVSGTVVGLGADWLMTAGVERFERPQFIAANREAVDATMATWREALTRHGRTAIEVWFADTRALVAARELTRSNRS